MGLQVKIEKTCIADARLYGSTWDNTGPQGTQTITTGMYSGTQHYGFLRFGEFEIPLYARIVSAVFRFYVSGGTDNSRYTHVVSGVKDNGTLWAESARNGAGRDTTATSSIALASKTGEWKSCDISAIAIAWQQRLMDATRGLCITCGTTDSYKIIDGRGRSNYPTLTIIYEIPASVPVPAEASVTLGGTVHTAIQTNEEGARHVVAYKIGDTVLYSEDIGEQTEHAYTVPASAGALFPNDPASVLTVEVTTTVNGEDRGTVAAEIELTLPADAAPTGTCTPGRSGQTLVPAYVQGRSSAIFSVSGTAKYGAQIDGYSLTFEGVPYTEFPATTPLIQGSGNVPYALTITDSRGLKTQVNGSIPVLALNKPNVVLFAASRCLIDGTLDDDGDYIRVAVSASVSSLSVGGAQKNKLTYRVFSRAVGTTTWEEAGGAPTPSGISIAHDYQLKTGSNPKEFNAYQGYEFKVEVFDLFDTTQQLYTIPTNQRQFVLGADRKSASFGGPITGTTDAPNVTFYHPALLLGGISQLDYSSDEVYTGAKWIDGKPIYRQVYPLPVMTAGQTKNVTLGRPFSYYGKIVRLYGITTGNSQIKPLPHVDSSTYFILLDIQSFSSGNNPYFRVICASSATMPGGGYAMIEYTKSS